ncbi:MAG TPA: hypothetical protein VGY54_11545, partial [Polyangiaceae bacterium]|nr:hypothetical protein [Polyangiaceae bacterium]
MAAAKCGGIAKSELQEERVMKLGMFVGIAAACGVALVAGCSVQESGTLPPPAPTNGVYMVRLETNNQTGLPTCSKQTGGETAMLTSTMTLESCIAGCWVPIPCASLIGGAVAYNSTTKTLWACTQNPDGGTAQWTQISIPQGPQGPAGPQG